MSKNGVNFMGEGENRKVEGLLTKTVVLRWKQSDVVAKLSSVGQPGFLLII
jgi:hypothetical protein